MKKLVFLSFFLLSMVFQSCLRDECTSHHMFVRLDPIYKTIESLRSEVFVTVGRDLKNPGKIYVYNNFLLINELNEGIHVYDNSNPFAPKNVSFINIPGNRDMAIKNNVLYADNAVDLLAIDITNTATPKVVKRLDYVFNRAFGWNTASAPNTPIFIGYRESNQTQILDCADPNFNQPFFNAQGGGIWFGLMADAGRANGFGATSSNAATKATGVGGSMSRFGIVDNYLYGIDQSDLHVFDIENPANPRAGKSVNVTWNIETLFPYKDKLFIGAQNGMFILENKNPESPFLLSSFSHAQACDPVFVDGDIAYVTLVGGNRCGNTENELDVIDISNITSPRLIKRYNMAHPLGLSVLDKKLYLCEGEYGFKIFDVKDVEKIDKNLLSHTTAFYAYDVIALSREQLIVVGKDGLIQLDASDPKKVKSISVIPIIKN